MIYFCPFCGYQLKRPLRDGITSCDSCNRNFDSLEPHRLLSSAWMFRRWNIYDLEILRNKCDLNDEETTLLKYVVDQDLCHDEILKILLSTV